MDNKEIIRNILIEEFSKINNVNYHFRYSNFLIKVNTKRLIPSLINQCHYFEAGIDKNWRFDHYKHSYFWISNKHFWSKFEKETSLKYSDIQQHIKDVLEEGFNLKGITPSFSISIGIKWLEEGFNLKGITPIEDQGIALLEEGFNLNGAIPVPSTCFTGPRLEEGFRLKKKI